MAGNFSYVVNSSFQPFTMQEMLVPFTAYKEAFEKTEEAYNALSDSDKFSYLSKTLPEGSEARKIYEGYANDLKNYATDLSQNGLTMANRSGLTDMRRRYAGEIGRLVQADEAMREEKKLRQQLNAQDSSRLYATDNLNIDNFLDGNTPNLYAVSGNELYARGAQAAKAYSSRVFDTGAGGSTLGGYYIDWIQRNGVSPESIATFRKNISSIPELAADVDAILKEKGVTQNLTGYNLERARESVINGMIDGAVYQEQHTPQRDLGKLTAAESEDLALKKQQLKLQAAASGMVENEDGSFTYDANSDPAYLKAVAKSGASGNYPGQKNMTYTPGQSGNPKMVDEIPERATKVNVSAEDGNYVISVGSGNNRYILGKIDNTGKFTLGGDGKKLDYNKFAEYFGHGMDWYQFGHTYDPKYDNQNIKALANKVLETALREGPNSYLNYNFYLEPDNTGYRNHGGGFYTEPLERLPGTVANGSLGTIDYGE